MSEAPLANVYVSGRFAGSILLRDWSFEAIDARDCAIGMFTSQREAAAALQEVDMQSATVAQTVPSKPVFRKGIVDLFPNAEPTLLAARRCSRFESIMRGKFATPRRGLP